MHGDAGVELIRHAPHAHEQRLAMACTVSGAKYKPMRESERYSSQSRSALARCAVAFSAQAWERPPPADRWPRACGPLRRRAPLPPETGSGSAKQVIPARSISASPGASRSAHEVRAQATLFHRSQVSVSQRHRGPRTGSRRSSV